jgi:CRP-like cAMP-binding protein
MEDLDFTRPARSPIYDPGVAHEFFRAAGRPESVQAGHAFFLENETSDTMYLLLEGEVGLVRGKKTIDIVKKGEVFGEMAAVSGQPRTASAIARTPCAVLALEGRRFQSALQKTPEFALMLLNIMINRLRLTIAMLGMTKSLPDWGGRGETRVFDERLLRELIEALPEHATQHHPLNKVIVKEGEAGVFMYVVREGRVAVTIQGRTVERIGPGGVFGEMALVDQSPRAASAVALTDCVLLAINRKEFLALVRARPQFGVTLLKGVAERLRFMTAHQR